MPPAPLAFPLAWIPGVTAWLVIWSGLAVATIALIVLMRTRLREVKPWKKCALLSLWVHVLLACLAATVRIGVGGPGIGPGSGGPIRVAIVNVPPTINQPDALPTALTTPPTLEFSRDAPAERAEPVNAAPEREPAAPDRPPAPAIPSTANAASIAVEESPALLPPLALADLHLDAPALLPQPKPKPKPKAKPPAPAEVASATPRPADQSSTTIEPVHSNPASTAAPNAAATAAGPFGALVDPNAAPRTGVPAAYANRFADRDALVAGGGGNPRTERAVRAALAWLAAAQERDGHWDPKRHGAGQERYVLGENRGAAGARADTGITALALLAFMGSGHTHREGPYADNIARGLDYLRRSQGANGNLGGEAEFFAHMYCHSMATFAMSEACALTRDAKLRPVIERAVAYSLAAQHPTEGGWRYKAAPGNDGGDTSQLGWQLMALKSAELAGVPVPAVTWTRAERFLRNVERGTAGGLAAYRPEGPPSRAMTAEALFCRQLLSHRADGAMPPAAIAEARRAILEEKPGGVMVNFYYWYYASIALHRARGTAPAADEAWAEWNDALTGALVDSQSGDGSWSTACVWGGYGGRVYTTSLAAMSLEVYYRYAPDDAEQSSAGVARRDEWQTVPAR